MNEKYLVQNESESEEEWECSDMGIVQNRFNPRHKDLGNEQDLRNYLYQQLMDDPIFGASVTSHVNLVEYMVNNKYTDIYEYLKVCNKQGLLLDTLVNRYFKIVKKPIKYNLIQCMKIHEQNIDQRTIQKTTVEISEIKLQRKLNRNNQQKEKKTFENFTMLCDPAEERKKIAEMIRERRLQNQGNQQNQQNQDNEQNQEDEEDQNGIEEEGSQSNDYVSELEPLDQDIDENMVTEQLKEYQKMYEQLLINFHPTQIQVEKDDNFVDYRNLSDDSLEPYYIDPPQQRQHNLEVMHFSFKMIPIKVVSKQLVINNNNNNI